MQKHSTPSKSSSHKENDCSASGKTTAKLKKKKDGEAKKAKKVNGPRGQSQSCHQCRQSIFSSKGAMEAKQGQLRVKCSNCTRYWLVLDGLLANGSHHVIPRPFLYSIADLFCIPGARNALKIVTVWCWDRWTGTSGNAQCACAIVTVPSAVGRSVFSPSLPHWAVCVCMLVSHVHWRTSIAWFWWRFTIC